MTQVAIKEVENHLSDFVTRASDEDIVIMRDGRAAAVIIGFEDEDDWLEYRLLQHPGFQARIAESRQQARAGRTVRLEDLPD